MAFDFNANEIFQMAIQIEQIGVKFYRNAAANVQKQEEKDLLLKLADMEVDHENTFASMKKSLAEDEKAKTIFDPNNETVLYLKSLADTRVFFQKTIDTTSLKEILKEAIVAEKDSIVFYLGMKELVPEGKGKNRLDAIIKEEIGRASCRERVS